MYSRIARSLPSTSTRYATRTWPLARRYMATAAPEPSTSTAPPPPALNAGSAKVQRIVDDIAALTLLEAADLVSQLKTRLNIQEIAMPAASAGPAAVAAAPVEAAEEEKPKEKTIFSVKLEKFDAASKAKIIKEIKAIVPNMNLVEAKKFVESAPKVIKENVPKEEAEKLKKTFTDLGATIVLE